MANIDTSKSSTAATPDKPLSNLQSPSTTANPTGARLWLEIGYEVNGHFVTLPMGLLIDTIDPVEVGDDDPERRRPQTAQNDLLQTLKNLGSGLRPGEEIKISSLVTKLRRVSEEQTCQMPADEHFLR